MSEYQNRVDIDKIYDDFYDYTGKTRVIVFLEGSKYHNISTRVIDDDGNTDAGTIDALMDYYQLYEVSDKIDTIRNTLDEIGNQIDTIENRLDTIIDIVYPIGTLYQTTDNSFDPNNSFGGVWENISNDNSIYVWERISETE